MNSFKKIATISMTMVFFMGCIFSDSNQTDEINRVTNKTSETLGVFKLTETLNWTEDTWSKEQYFIEFSESSFHFYEYELDENDEYVGGEIGTGQLLSENGGIDKITGLIRCYDGGNPPGYRFRGWFCIGVKRIQTGELAISLESDYWWGDKYSYDSSDYGIDGTYESLDEGPFSNQSLIIHNDSGKMSSKGIGSGMTIGINFKEIVFENNDSLEQQKNLDTLTASQLGLLAAITENSLRKSTVGPAIAEVEENGNLAIFGVSEGSFGVMKELDFIPFP